MERGDELHHFRRPAQPCSTSVLGMLQSDNNNNNNNNHHHSSNGQPDGAAATTANNGAVPVASKERAAATVREQDQYMPIANVIRIMRRILPPHAKISDDAKETIQECVSEYISFITGEANDRCQREQRKTITAEDVLWAMGKLGFDDYVHPLTVFLNRYRELENDRSSLRGDPFLKRAVADYGPIGGLGPYGPPFNFNMGNQPPGMFDPSAGGPYYRDGSGSGGSSAPQNSLASFDPYAQFK